MLPIRLDLVPYRIPVSSLSSEGSRPNIATIDHDEFFEKFRRSSFEATTDDRRADVARVLRRDIPVVHSTRCGASYHFDPGSRLSLDHSSGFCQMRQWSSSDPRYEPFDLRSEETPDAVTGSVAAIAPRLESIGFQNRGHFRVSKAVTNGGAYVTLFENRQSNQYAKLFTVVVGLSLVRKIETTLAFFTDFTDGMILVTGKQ